MPAIAEQLAGLDAEIAVSAKGIPQEPSGAEALMEDDVVVARAMAILDSRIRQRGQSLASLDDVLRHAALSLSGERVEVLLCYWMDSSKRVVSIDRAAEGAIGSAVFSPRELARAAVLNDASWCVLVHNHPSGDPAPSDDDEKATQIMQRTLSAVGVLLVGSYVVAGTQAECISTGRKIALSVAETEPSA